MDIRPKRSTLNLNPNGSVKEAKHQHHVITHDDGAATCVSIDDMDLDPRQVPLISPLHRSLRQLLPLLYVCMFARTCASKHI